MSVFKVSPENRNLDYYLEMYNNKIVDNDSLEVIQLYYYLYENVDVYTGELYILEKHKPDLDGFFKRVSIKTRRNVINSTGSHYYNIYQFYNYNPITLLENHPKLYLVDGFSNDIMKIRSIIWNDAYNDNGDYNNVSFDMLMLAYKLGDIKHLLSPIKGITKL